MISAIIITKNESEHIARCIESILWADEIIILDSGSTDDTVAICKQYTPHVFTTDWPGFGLQKQRALDKANGDWVFSIDADEYVTSELKQEIQKATQQKGVDGFDIPRLSSYCGKNIMHAGWWPDYTLRLFKRESGYFTDSPVHEKIIVQGTIQKFNYPILHEAFIDPDEVLHKVNSYSTLGAKKLLKAQKKTNLPSAIFRGFWSFFRTYFLKLAILDGQHGLMLSISNAEGTYYKYLKLWLSQNQQEKNR